MSERELRLNVSLVFWQLYDTGLAYNPFLHSTEKDSMQKLLRKAGYGFPYESDSGTPEYVYEDSSGYSEKVGWLASTAQQYMPLIIDVASDTFTSSSGTEGSITIQAHLHYGGCLLFDCRLEFSKEYTVSQLVRGSSPKDVQLRDKGMSLWEFMIGERIRLINIIRKSSLVTKRRRNDNLMQTQPWHHNWIIRKTEKTTAQALANDTWQKEFLPGGKYFRHALGLTQRSDTWQTLSTDFYGKQLTNWSPYENSIVYITNAGNVIVPNKALVNPEAFKNKLVDIMFGCEIGNVQRFLSLKHVTNISKEAIQLQLAIQQLHEKRLSESQLAEEIRDLEEEFTRISLEISDDLMIFKVRRLMFTSILKLTLFVEMIEALHGFEYQGALEGLLSKMQEALCREREVLTIRISQQESTMLRNLQLVFIVTLATEIIALFFYDPASLTWSLGSLLFIVSVVITLALYFAIRLTLRRRTERMFKRD
jgi:hypothetical protein